MIVCLRDSKVAVERLKPIYLEEAKHAALDITASKVSWQYSSEAVAVACSTRNRMLSLSLLRTLLPPAMSRTDDVEYSQA